VTWGFNGARDVDVRVLAKLFLGQVRQDPAELGRPDAVELGGDDLLADRIGDDERQVRLRRLVERSVHR
jgi:hypothetical protein